MTSSLSEDLNPTQSQPQLCVPEAPGGGTSDRRHSRKGQLHSPMWYASGSAPPLDVSEKREFELEVGKNATRIETFIAALRALVKEYGVLAVDVSINMLVGHIAVCRAVGVC
jgi:hypothetical protein